MKTIIAAIGVLMLTGCGSKIELPKEYADSEVAAVCHDGTWVVRNPKDGRLRTIKLQSSYSTSSSLTSLVDKSVQAQDVCH